MVKGGGLKVEGGQWAMDNRQWAMGNGQWAISQWVNKSIGQWVSRSIGQCPPRLNTVWIGTMSNREWVNARPADHRSDGVNCDSFLLLKPAMSESTSKISLFTIHHSLFTIHYSPFTIHYSLFLSPHSPLASSHLFDNPLHLLIKGFSLPILRIVLPRNGKAFPDFFTF
jgi:hypothetical protein